MLESILSTSSVWQSGDEQADYYNKLFVTLPQPTDSDSIYIKKVYVNLVDGLTPYGNRFIPFDVSTQPCYDIKLARFSGSTLYEKTLLGRINLRESMANRKPRFTFSKTSGASSMTIDIGNDFLYLNSQYYGFSLSGLCASSSYKLFVAKCSDTSVTQFSVVDPSYAGTNKITIPCSSTTTTSGSINLYWVVTSDGGSTWKLDEYDSEIFSKSISINTAFRGGTSFAGLHSVKDYQYGVFVSRQKDTISDMYDNTHISVYYDATPVETFTDVCFYDLIYDGNWNSGSTIGNVFALSGDDYIKSLQFVGTAKNSTPQKFYFGIGANPSVEWNSSIYIPSFNKYTTYRQTKEVALNSNLFRDVGSQNGIGNLSDFDTASVLIKCRRFSRL